MRNHPTPSKIVFFLIFTITITNCNNLRSQWDNTSLLAARQASNEPGASIIGFVIGPVVFALSFVMIWYSEKRAAINYKRILKINNLLGDSKFQNKDIKMDEQLVGEDSKYKLIHLSGKVKIQKPPLDPISRLQIPNALKLQRQVQVRQYRKFNNSKDEQPVLGWYNYNLPQVDSRKNDESNWFLKSEVFTSPCAIIEGFKMNSQEMKSLFNNSVVVPTQQIAISIAEETNRPKIEWIIQGDYIYYPAQTGQIRSHGSLRVKYSYFKPNILSIISSYNEQHTLQPFRIDLYQNKGKEDTLCCEGKSACFCCNTLGKLLRPISNIDEVAEGKKSKDEMIQNMIANNKVQTLILRILGYVVMVLGIYAFFSPIVEIIGYIPLVGGFLKGAASSLVLLGAVIVCIPLFLITFSLAWLVYHPKTGIILIVAALIVIGVIVVLDITLQNST